MPKFTCMNKECNNHAFGCSGNCKFETVAFNKNGDCLQFEAKVKKIKKLDPSALNYVNTTEISISKWLQAIVIQQNELIDAVNELRQTSKLNIDSSGICPLTEMLNTHCTKCLRKSNCSWFNRAKEAGLIGI